VRSASITYMIRHYAGRRRSDLVLITRIMPQVARLVAWTVLYALRARTMRKYGTIRVSATCG
jgi:hypothetical protein